VDWNTTKVAINNYEAKCIASIIAQCREILAIMKRRWPQSHRLSLGSDIGDISEHAADNPVNDKIAGHLWSTANAQSTEASCCGTF